MAVGGQSTTQRVSSFTRLRTIFLYRRRLAARRQSEMKEAESSYSKWLEAKKQEALKSRFSEKELQAAIQEMVAQRSRIEGAFTRMSESSKVALAKLRLLKEIEDTLSLPTFEEWLSQNAQTSLFRD